MGAIKYFNYSPQVISISLLGRAIAHPCRVQMIELLIENKKLNNQGFSMYFGMTRSTIHDHLVKLWQADIITIQSGQEGTIASITESQIEKYNQLVSLFSFDVKDAFHLSVLK
ncbi:MAG: regulatory protein ArsR [Fluviicola sp.]|jgi:predicted transcriptional regulator|uniref:ArsR/SmtB family transcription factor n=1 Tax=Fluviicola sp. TaxID=1917219 RepID=UPI00260BFBF0|nr:helix-turn-helix transcriptional regulator [Fluviicola sp.]MDF3025939.1 regulatory protein ArsR [Fluviicola sp.]